MTEPQEIFSLFLKQIQQNEEKIIRQILAQILKREVVLEDAKRLTKIYRTHINHLNYDLAFDNVIIGHVTFENSGAQWTVTFKPTNPTQDEKQN